MACEGLERLHELLRCSLNVWNEAPKTGGRIGSFGFSHGRLRRGEMFTVLCLNWKVPASFWLLGEGVGMLRWGRGGLRWKIGAGRVFWQEVLQVFEVMGSGCGVLLS